MDPFCYPGCKTSCHESEIEAKTSIDEKHTSGEETDKLEGQEGFAWECSQGCPTTHHVWVGQQCSERRPQAKGHAEGLMGKPPM